MAEDPSAGRADVIARPEVGSGPGVLVLTDEIADPGGAHARRLVGLLAEEGYVAYAPAGGDVPTALEALRADRRQVGLVGAIGFGSGGARAAEAAAAGMVDCAVSYDAPEALDRLDAAVAAGRAVAVHLAGRAPGAFARHADRPAIALYAYPACRPGFAVAGSPCYDKGFAGIAYSRSLGLLRRTLGPWFDLDELWEAHIACEFVTRDADAAMATMVAEPYVNHVPTMIGGYGRDLLARFYRHHFIPQGPKDRKVIPISRTVGADRLVHEQVFCFTHDAPLDWVLPGVAPTGRYIEMAMVAIVAFRGDKLVNEHIYWDQASVLVQAGLLDPEGLPVYGREQARKLLDPALPGGNDRMPGWRETLARRE